MLYLGLGIIAGIVLGAFLCVLYSQEDYILCAIGGGIVISATIIALLAWLIMAWDYKASAYKSAIINREYGTSYTREEVFYASTVIDIIHELDRKRIEVNGDLLKEKK